MNAGNMKYSSQSHLLSDGGGTDDEVVEFDSCRIKRDWETGEEGSLIGRNILDGMENEAQNISFFSKLFTLTEMLGILCVALVGVWIGYFRGGFAWRSNPSLEFNWHPFLMVFGLVFLYANGALIYRGFRSEKKKKLKIMHMLTHLVAFVSSVLGLIAVFDFHSAIKKANMYSLHSWIGLCVVILFACQWVSGLLTFLFPGLRPSVRAAYLPVHQFFGLVIFVGAVCTSLLGLTEKAFFVLKGEADYASFPAEGVLVNVIGLLLLLFAGMVIYLTSNPHFRRQTSEDEVLLTDTVLE